MKKILLGLLGGAALGMLFAPEKGEKFRKKLSESDDKLKDFGGEMLSAGKNISSEVQKFLESEEAKEFFSKGKTKFSELSEKGQVELKNAVEKVKKLGTDLSSEVCSDEKICSEISEKTENPETSEKNKKKEDVLAGLKNFFRK